jgi:hypothetical protein
MFGIILVVVGAAITFPLWSPLFIDRVVDEPLPGLTADQQTFAQALPEEQRIMLADMAQDNPAMMRDTVSAMMEDDTQITEPMPTMAATAETTEPVALLSGMFSGFDAIHYGEGRATVYELPDGSRILRFEDFDIGNGPDLYVYLTTERPTSISESFGDFIDLGALKGNIGNQNYTIPAGTDLTLYNTVVIYCRPFQVNFVVAPLNEP